MSTLETLPQYFLRNVKKYGADKVAVRQKEFGIWQEFTWQDSYENVKNFTLGMIALGMQRGDHVCTIGDNDKEYLWGYISIQALGGAAVGMYTDAIPKEMEYIINHSDSVLALAQDQEQCDKFLEMRDQVPNIKKLIYWEDQGLWNYDEDWLISFEEVQELGRELAKKEPNRFEEEIAKGSGEDICALYYTSGTTGLPKGVMLTHNNLMKSASIYHEADPRKDTDNHVSFAPMGWIAEPAIGVAPHMYVGMIMNFPEEPETVRQNIREIAPEMIFYNSRLWDDLVSTIQVRINDSTWLNRKLYEMFLPVGYQYADKTLNKESIGPGLNFMNWLGNLLVFGPLRNQLGLSKVRSAYTAGAVLSPDAIRFIRALGINLKQLYGSTETTATATIHPTGDIKFASIGKASPQMKVRISDEGEIQICGPSVMKGYYKNPEATAKDILVEEDGSRWFCSGDAGYIDEDNHVIFQDRVKNMLRLANGEVFSPQFIEGRLKFSPYIRDVMAIGGETRDHVTALVIINFENVGHWAEKRGIGYTTFVDLSQKPEVYDLIQTAVSEVNKTLPKGARISRYVNLHKEFDADEAEMTRSRKLKRNVLADKYGDIIEAMYGGDDEIQVRAVVSYQDGSEGFVETNLRIMSVAETAVAA